MTKKVKPATLFEVWTRDKASKGTLLIADFGEGRTLPDFMATLAPPPFVAPPGFRLESAAVRALAEQVQGVLDRLAAVADDLERKGR
jgi:hypothetical protein